VELRRHLFTRVRRTVSCQISIIRDACAKSLHFSKMHCLLFVDIWLNECQQCWFLFEVVIMCARWRHRVADLFGCNGCSDVLGHSYSASATTTIKTCLSVCSVVNERSRSFVQYVISCSVGIWRI
jgi:hypothetical protein